MKIILAALILFGTIFILSIPCNGQTKTKKQLTCTVTEIVDRGKGKVHCMAVTEAGKTISIKRTGNRSGEIVPGSKLLLVSRYKTRYEDWKVASIKIVSW